MRCCFVVLFCLLLTAPGRAQSWEEACYPIGITEGSLLVDGQERSYIAYVPTNYDGTQPLPLLLVFHGFASSPFNIMRMSGFNMLADEQQFMVIYPGGSEQPAVWYSGTSVLRPFDDDRDLRFIDALLDRLIAEECVDTQRVYAVGFSMGGGMVHRLACERSERLAAVGTVAGAFATIPGGCLPDRPVPIMALHGLRDRVVPFNGAGLLLPDVSEWISGWAQRNRCADVRDYQPPFERGVHFKACAQGAEVVLITGERLGHTWPGTPHPNRASRLGGEDDGSINATRLLWTFLSRYTLP
jgi:polyhydroxybutyrate depolymerase